MSKQLHLQLTASPKIEFNTPIIVGPIPSADATFDFPGHIRRGPRTGGFQFRFGRKILPIDETLTNKKL